MNLPTITIHGVNDAEVTLVWDPPWHPSMMTEAGRSITRARSY